MTPLLLVAITALAADPLPEAAQKELKKLQGEWIAQRFEKKGEGVDVKDLETKLVMEIKDAKWIFTGQDKAKITAIDANSDPKCIDLESVEESRKGKVDEGIFKIEGDTLTVCLNQGSVKQRPTSFKTSVDEPDFILAVFKRAKKD